jgi:REP element-mobilizing transposase RayT
VAHHRRPKLHGAHPVHVTWRIGKGLPNMRSPEAMRGFRSAFVAGKRRGGFRLVHYSVQDNHVHLICEADDSRTLSRGLMVLGSAWLAASIARWGGRARSSATAITPGR